MANSSLDTEAGGIFGRRRPMQRQEKRHLRIRFWCNVAIDVRFLVRNNGKVGTNIKGGLKGLRYSDDMC